MPLLDKDLTFTAPIPKPQIFQCEWCGGIEWHIKTNRKVICTLCHAEASVDDMFRSLTH